MTPISQAGELPENGECRAKRASAVVLISGGGTNLQALLDQIAAGLLPMELKAVISNRPNVRGLVRAQMANVPALCIDHQKFDCRDAFDEALALAIDETQAEFIILAGFMRILSGDFTRRYAGRMINLHPSLLPKYPGLHTYRKALAAGDREHGASIHFVTDELDGGPVIAQAYIPVLPGDDELTLQRRLAPVEHRLLLAVVYCWVAGRITCHAGQVLLDGKRLSQPMVLNNDEKLAFSASLMLARDSATEIAGSRNDG